MVVGLLLSAGLIYFYRSKAQAKIPQLAAWNETKEAELPSNSWYNNSWWSYVSSSPSVRQILKKNAEANGTTPSLEKSMNMLLSW